MTADTAMVWLAAIAPALLWALILWLVARPASAGAAVAGALLGGIIVAWPASHVSQALFDAAASLAGDSSARLLVPGILVPVVEEAAKASVIVLLLPWMPHRIAVGAAVGAAVGLGFTPVENLQQLTLAAIQGGETGLWRAAYVRGVLGGLHHATFAATTGVGFAYARFAPAARKRWSAAALGLLAAVLLHVAWNEYGASALTDALCGAAHPGASCSTAPPPAALLLAAPLLSFAFVVPVLLVLAVVVRRLERSPSE